MATYRRWIGCAVAAACLAAAPVSAQPTISGVTGVVANKQNIVISGGAFGAKAAPAPLAWEDFSDGNLTSALVTRNGPVVINSNNLRHAFSTRNARSDYKAGGYYFGYDAGTAPKWFVQYWIKLAPNWHWGRSTFGGPDDGLANIKFFRVFPVGDRNYANVGYQIHGFSEGGVHRFVENGASGYIGSSAFNLFTLDTWHSVQVEYGENSGVDQQNGRLRLWIDGVLRDNVTNLNTNPAADGPAINKRPFIVGFYDSWSPSDANVDNMYAYYTDIYVDNSWARVEIGNAATYNACTLREIQLPIAWSASSVSVRVNQGSFANGQAAYVYVVDANGAVNSAGYPIKIGATTPPPPSPPSNLRVVK